MNDKKINKLDEVDTGMRDLMKRFNKFKSLIVATETSFEISADNDYENIDDMYNLLMLVKEQADVMSDKLDETWALFGEIKDSKGTA